MAKKKIHASVSSENETSAAAATIGIVDATSLQTTGRYIVVFKGAAREGKIISNILNKTAGLKNVISASEFKGSSISSTTFAQSEAVNFEHLGIAMVSGEDAIQSLAASTQEVDSPILAIEPEYVAYLSDPNFTLEYFEGYKDAVNHLYDNVRGSGAGRENTTGLLAQTFQDTDQFTWGLQATKTNTSRFSGKGIKVAVLDTGFDFSHPDFRGRSIISETFSGFPVQDINGHGTHCVGTACGPLRPATGVRRYGVAHAAQIHVGKVFNNDARPGAATGDVLAGIEWAISQGCSVISLSIGVPINQKIEQYEAPIRRALAAGTLIVAAAGNNARRPGNAGFVEPPANADASMAVAALDSRLKIAEFSAQSSSITGDGGKVNVAAPGVGIFSSVPVNIGRHEFFNGTSMATPHVAGIAALLAEASGQTGQALWSKVTQTALPLSLPSNDVGAGLAQAPQ